MNHVDHKTFRNLSFLIVAILFGLVTTLAFVSDLVHEPSSGFLRFAVEHHAIIMAGLMAISLLFGFFFSQLLYTELQKKKLASKSILAVVLLFLSREEKEIVNFLVSQKGITTQAEIARLPHMNRVKAHRSLQKMREKQIIELIAHGKIRKVLLTENILQLLLEDGQ